MISIDAFRMSSFAAALNANTRELSCNGLRLMREPAEERRT